MKRIIYKKCVYERLGSSGPAFHGQVESISNAVLQLAKSMDNTFSTRDNIVMVLAEIKERLFEKVTR